MVKVLMASLALTMAMTLGCEKKADQAKSGSAPAAQKDEHGHEAGSHEGHQHGAGAGGHEHHAGEKHDLGTTKVGEFEVAASYSGTMTPGEELDIDLAVKGERAKLAAIRAWIGVDDAKGSLKAKAAPEGEGYHAEVEVPGPLPEGAAVWVEIETNQGQKLLGSLALKR
ncbi:MAG: hypothetical protein AMXMBFR13_34260 [Phycisphaerae bacterium]